MKIRSQELLKHNMQWLLLVCVFTIHGASEVDSVTPRLPGNDSTLGSLEEFPNDGHTSNSQGTGDTNKTGNVSEIDNLFLPVTMETSTNNYVDVQNQDERQEQSNTVTPDDVSASKTYDVLSWLPKRVDKRSTVNLTILPILAMLAFLVGLCLKGCTWFRESLKESDRDSMDDDRSFIILREGDKEYHDVDFRSNLSTPYDTYSSYMSFLKRNNDTVTSFRSFQNQVCQPYDTVTSYRSLLLQRLDSHNNDSVNSYRAFMQRMSQMKDVEIQVELFDEKNKDTDQKSTARSLRTSHRSRSTSPKLKRKFNHGEGVLEDLVETTDCVQKSDYNENGDLLNVPKVAMVNGVKHHHPTILPNRHTPHMSHHDDPNRHTPNMSPSGHRIERSPIHHHDRRPVRHGDKMTHRSPNAPRFKVSFVTDGEDNPQDHADSARSVHQEHSKSQNHHAASGIAML
ncbi:uncharacterized protein LOC124254183 [Haliotis rubra]|uniref:uncharacterized protein LOC124254183 n=1 Tax=Haliotis rubra TaxID=36100 RepID=UPI001EE5136D|nr:uncharacterized protein LOC124254183 [Haliotis rubra]XP_046544024.1 uncharacterized protein LOC124254183 [Haliotis rubra]XP_046544025.1 uncharacterized protein LOC124254183 [Haliotis rubra]